MEEKKRGFKEWFTSSQVLLGMILVQIFLTGLQLLSRIILVRGFFIFSLIVYRHLVAAICVAPFAFYFERGRTKKYTLKVWFWLFVNALTGMVLAQGLFYYGLRDTSATYSVNFLNLVPISTFFTSIIFRWEKLGLHTWAGRAKCGGAILCVGGALATSLYKGKEFYLGHHSHHVQIVVAAHKTHMLRGTFLLICSCFSYTTWFIVQVQLLKVFPLRYTGTMLACILAAIQGGIIGICIDSRKAAWRLEWNLQLVTILYSGALATAATFSLLSWVITIKGPSYPPMFNPLGLIFVAFSEAIILGEPLTVGMLLGMILIMVGLYFFLWGKNNETKRMVQQPIVSIAEVSNVTDLSTGAESVATIVPNSSPTNSALTMSHTEFGGVIEGKIRMNTLKKWFTSSQAILSMVLVQLFVTGLQLLSRVILVKGSFIGALITYRHIVAAICVAPFALYFERGLTKKFTWKVWFWLFINALMGMTLAQGLFYYGLRDTSATFSVNFLNLVPITTFFTSIICRMEKLRLQTWAGKAKCVGAILCVGGALVNSLYKGKEFYLGHHSHHAQTATAAHKTNMLRGTLFLICSCFSLTAWFIAQVKLLRIFPLRFWGTMIACILAAIQAAIIGAFLDSSKASWRLEWDLQLITIVYSGALATAASFCFLSWAIKIKGPSYPPMFNPLALIFVAISEAIVLGQPIGVETLVGMVLIIMGLYFFLWGKNNDTQRLPQPNGLTSMPDTSIVAPSSSPTDTSVLLQIDKTCNKN